MFEIELYFDDSGTDTQSPVAVAACYLADKTQWDEFVRNWDQIRLEEGFDVFHMAEFIAKPEMEHKPFCDWSNVKKDRVYRKLATIIGIRVRRGFAVAIPKKPFDAYVFDELRKQFAENHYVLAVKQLAGLIENWRHELNVNVPMRYVFDHGSLGESQIARVWEECHSYEGTNHRYGIVPGGVTFQDKRHFKPLQAADILAWQMHNHMRRTIMDGRDPTRNMGNMHSGFKFLLSNSPHSLTWHNEETLRRWFEDQRKFHTEKGFWPWEPQALRGFAPSFSSQENPPSAAG